MSFSLCLGVVKHPVWYWMTLTWTFEEKQHLEIYSSQLYPTPDNSHIAAQATTSRCSPKTDQGSYDQCCLASVTWFNRQYGICFGSGWVWRHVQELCLSEVYSYSGHTLFSGIGSCAKEPQSVWESSDLGDVVPPMGMRAAMADISPVWLSAVIPGRSEVWFKLLSGMVPIPVKCWIRHFLNWRKEEKTNYKLN